MDILLEFVDVVIFGLEILDLLLVDVLEFYGEWCWLFHLLPGEVSMIVFLQWWLLIINIIDLFAQLLKVALILMAHIDQVRLLFFQDIILGFLLLFFNVKFHLLNKFFYVVGLVCVDQAKFLEVYLLLINSDQRTVLSFRNLQSVKVE